MTTRRIKEYEPDESAEPLEVAIVSIIPRLIVVDTHEVEEAVAEPQAAHAALEELAGVGSVSHEWKIKSAARSLPWVRGG